MRVAMIAPPWLAMPPCGYGGLEYVVHYLTVELERRGVAVELFATADSSTPCTQLHSLYDSGQYAHIADSLYDVAALPIGHLLFALEHIRRDGGFDIVHDHNGFLGPAMGAYASPGSFPPILHTLHGPFTDDSLVAGGACDTRDMYDLLARCDRLYFNAISHAQLEAAPPTLLPKVVDVIHNAINVYEYDYQAEKDDYFITLARFSRDKGAATAARLARQMGVPLRMAGVVNGISTPMELSRQLDEPDALFSRNSDFAYFRDEVLPLIEPGKVEYVGNLSGTAKMRLVANARALLFPIAWEEPFGLAVIEAMACGTPVVAMRRGAMPELIEHGVNGFLAENEAQFLHFMGRVDQLDPADCRRTVERRFSASVMADAYLASYRTILARHPRPDRSVSSLRPMLARMSRSSDETSPSRRHPVTTFLG